LFFGSKKSPKKETKKPTDKQRKFAKDLGIKIDRSWDRDRLSIEIDKAKQDPATNARAFNRRQKRLAEEAIPDEEKDSPELIARRDEWTDRIDKWGIVIYRKAQGRAVDVVQVSDCEIAGPKKSPQVCIDFQVCKVCRMDGFKIVDFYDNPKTIRESDLLQFIECDEPYEPEELEELKQQGEKAAKKIKI